MGFVTKIFYGGQNPCSDGTTLIYVTLYLNKSTNKDLVANKIGFVYEFSRFRYIPYWSWWTGIADFSYANDTDQINPNNVSPHIHEQHSTQDQLQNTINDIGNQPLNRNLPWWDVHIIHCNNNQNQQQTCQDILIFRCHHCLGDGATLMKFLLPGLLSNSDGKAIDFNITPRKPASLSCCTIFAIIVNALWCVYALLVKTADTFDERFFTMCATFGTQSLLHQSISSETVESIQTILNKDDNVRNELNVMEDDYISINDIVMSISSGASRGLLLQETDKSSLDNGVYKCLMVIAQPFEMEKAKTIQNGWILASVPFFINVENHITRLIETATILKTIKNPYHLWTTFGFYENIGNLWIFAIKTISYRLACTHSCHYSMLNCKPYKEDGTFIFGTDIKVTDIGVFVGDTKKTHIIEVFKFGDRLSLNMVCGRKGEQYGKQWFAQFDIVSKELLQSLHSLQVKQTKHAKQSNQAIVL